MDEFLKRVVKNYNNKGLTDIKNVLVFTSWDKVKNIKFILLFEYKKILNIKKNIYTGEFE